jgi:hypothetical protein
MNTLHSVLRLLLAADFPSSLILFPLLMEATQSSETSVLTSATRRHNQQYGILFTTPKVS